MKLLTKTLGWLLDHVISYSEERARERVRIGSIPLAFVFVLRLVAIRTNSSFNPFVVGAFLVATLSISYTIRKRILPFRVAQYIMMTINLSYIILINSQVRGQTGRSAMDVYAHSAAPYIPTLALVYMSGGFPGLVQIVVSFAFLIWAHLQSLGTPGEIDIFVSVLNGWIIQTIVGYTTVILEAVTEKQLQNALNSAIESNAAKTKFVSWLSHDLRTPLVGMYGFVDQLLQDTNPTAEQKGLIGKLRLSADAVGGLITNLLDFSMLESGVFQLKPQVFNVHTSFQYLFSILEPIAQKDRTKLNFTFTMDGQPIDPTTSVNIYGDWLRLQQVCTNLITNAIRHSPQFTTVTVRFEMTKRTNSKTDDEISKADAKQDFVSFDVTVEDNGSGIKKEDMPYLFDPFFQATRSSEKGAGLGLYIVREVVKSMHGTVSATSQFGKGSKFMVRNLIFPLATESQVNQQNNSASSGIPTEIAQKTRILIAEDNAVNQQVLKRVLLRSQFQFKMVNDGQEAIMEWSTNGNTYDLILMDLQMPIRTGMEATKEIRRLEKERGVTAGIPIIALTATTFPSELQEALDIGMNGVLLKPCKQLDLETTVFRFVSKSHLITQDDIDQKMHSLQGSWRQRRKSVDPASIKEEHADK